MGIAELIVYSHLRAFEVVRRDDLEGRASGGVGLRTSNLPPFFLFCFLVFFFTMGREGKGGREGGRGK